MAAKPHNELIDDNGDTRRVYKKKTERNNKYGVVDLVALENKRYKRLNLAKLQETTGEQTRPNLLTETRTNQTSTRDRDYNTDVRCPDRACKITLRCLARTLLCAPLWSARLQPISEPYFPIRRALLRSNANRAAQRETKK